MDLSSKICKRAAAVSAVAVGLTGAVAVAPAAATTRRPPCTRSALTAGLKRGSDKHPNGKIPAGRRNFGCAGRYAYAAVDLKFFTITQVYRASGTRWVTISRIRPCNKRLIPRRIYRPACLTD